MTVKVAKLNSNNKVLQVSLMSDIACMSEQGTITMESVQQAATNLFGEGTYVPDLTPETHGAPSLGFNYDPINKVFFEDKPKDPATGQLYDSWTLNIEKGIWEAPQTITNFNDIIMTRWKEDIQKFKGKKAKENRLNENSNYWSWNNISKQWEDTGSSVF